MNEKIKSVGKTLSILSLVLAIISIFLAVLFDFISFKDAILHFVGGIIISCIVFVFLVAFFIVSFILIFGFYLVKLYGFLPLSISINLFKEIMGDIVITNEQIITFRIFRFILLAICITILIISIIARIKIKKEKEVGLIFSRSVKNMAKSATILAIIGLIISLVAIIISSSVL